MVGSFWTEKTCEKSLHLTNDQDYVMIPRSTNR